MLFRGVGGSWSPHTPYVDELLNERLSRRGYVGSRAKPSVFGSTSKGHAFEYAREQKDEFLCVLEPQAGAVISWAPRVRDLIITFEKHLNSLRFRRVDVVNGVKVGELLADMAGSCDIADTYLSLGRMRRELGALADLFFDDIPIVEYRISHPGALDELLDGHNGEVWLTGPCIIKSYDPAHHPEFSWITPTPPTLR